MMEFKNLSREKLIELIQSLNSQIEEYQKERIEEEKLNYAWTGNLGHWYWNFQKNTVTFNPLKVTTLGYDLEEVPAETDYQYFTNMLHPEDFEIAMDAMRKHLSGEKNVYETEYRIKTKNGNWRWYHDIGRITKRTEDGRPILVAGIVFDVTERNELLQKLKEQNEILEKIATTDELTQLFNRRMIFSKLEEEMERVNRYGTPLTILMMDVDHYKSVNDNYGHLRGDEVLHDLGMIITRVIRKVDFAGRYGGEEFLIVFTNTSLSDGLVVAERIRQAVSQKSYDDGLVVTISGGITEYKGGPVDDLLNDADNKLYLAKERGRNRIVDA